MDPEAEAGSPLLPAWKASFLQTCLDNEILRFGTFTLKSGRRSPYFFNAGLFHRADLLRAIATAYADAILRTPGLEFDVLFGPAYKGIPLTTATTLRLAELAPDRYGGLSYAFDRKEAKDHGEGGSIVGCPLTGKRVVIVDDVITAGTAVRHAVDVIEREGGTLTAIVVALDRMEKMPTAVDDDDDDDDHPAPRPSAIGEVRRQYGVPTVAVLTLDDIIAGLSGTGTEDDLNRLHAYRRRYRASE